MQSSRLTAQFLELSIVGSSCTVHEDERKYLEIEQGLHLIPWTGNTALLVDRYDARTFLDDQSKFGLKSSFPFKPTQEEIGFELMCDKERYLELNTELSEVQSGTEEEEKRALESFAQIPYIYEPSQGIQTKSEVVGTGNSGETVTNENTYSNIFTPSLALKIPPNMATPDNEKMHAIIVKTASHVAEKGNQLEIIIKTKQQFNSSFDFLNLEDILNPYYKHVKSLILSGAFKPLGGSQQGVNERVAPEYPTPPPHSDPSPGYPGGNPPQNVTVPNIPQGIPGNQTELTQENKDLTAESNSSSGGEMELHPLLRYSSTSGSSSKFKPIPVKAKRRQKAKLFLERIKKETKTESADFAREMDNDDTGSELPADVYITPPPPDLQQLIDKVAYQVVSSTSESFERHLKEGGNSIYDFLYPSNQYNAYYRVRKGMLTKNENIPQMKVLEQGKNELVPISFSFQKKMNNKDLGQKVYLGGDSSSGEEDLKINQSRTHEYDNRDHGNGSKSECIQTTRRKRVAEFMQKIKDKKSKKVGKLKLKPRKVSGTTELYHPEFPTDEPAERKVYHQPPVQYEVVKTEQSRESDWRTVSSLSSQDTLTDVVSAKIRHK